MSLVRIAIATGLLVACLEVSGASAESLQRFESVGDAIPQSLTGTAGDVAKGRTLVMNRQTGLCVLCHSGPFPDPRMQGNIAPNLEGVGGRLSEGQLRLQMVDSARNNPDTIMPSYYRIEGLERVAPKFQGKPLLSAAEIEDVVAYLQSLQN